MTINLLYLLSFLLPLVLMPMVLPALILVAHRKHITDAPGERKLQKRPVAVMGGTLIMLVIGITSVVVNLFHDMSPLMPVVCVMFMLYIFGIMDDTIGLDWKYKLFIQACAITLLFFGSNYGVHSIYSFFGLENLPIYISFPITLLCGLILLNAVNFADGIDGLASAEGVLAGLTMGIWHARHGFEIQTIISLVMVGIMVSFFCFNVFSKRFKTYLGDSGSSVLALFIYVMVCDDKISMLNGDFLADNYSLSFILSVLSFMVFDMVRVVFMRLVRRRVVYEGDRTHLHHIYVDLGMSHFMATTVIVLCNLAVIAMWYLTANAGMAVVPQLIVTMLAAVVFFWLPFFAIAWCNKNRIAWYIGLTRICKKISGVLDYFVDFCTLVIDGRWSKEKRRRVRIL